MDFLFRTLKADLIDTLETLEQDINLQKQQVNELIDKVDRKEKYITDDVNIVKNVLEKLDYKELKALQTVFYEMEQHFYMMNRTEEEQQEFVKGLAEDINDLPTLTIGEDDWVI